jgi:serine/threonine-protein kinase
MAIEAGRVLNERYRLIRPVGQGSQASVWVAEHLALTTHVAVKLISQELAKKDTARERFRREATAAAQLRSAHVVQILDHGIDGDQPFIVMELLDGEDLFERLAHRNRLSLRETSKIITQVARALSRAHAAGIVHRDLKPENVFLCPNDDDEVVKVLDFGVAKVKDAAKVTMQKTGVGTLIGTPHYMSPEQVKGIGEIDYHTDLWALGVIAFQCVTGELPYDSEGVGDLLIKITIGDSPVPSKIYPGVSPSFDQWFAKACARDPQKRFQSAREMAVALAGVVGVIDGTVPRSPTIRPPSASYAPAAPAPRAATQQLEADDWEEIGFDEASAPHAAAAAVVGPSQEIVDFDETIPAHDANVPAMIRAQHAAWEAKQASQAQAQAERSVPPPTPSVRSVPPPAPSRPVPTGGAPAAQDDASVLQPNGAFAPWETSEPAAPRHVVVPAPAPSSTGAVSVREPPPPPRSSPHPTGVPVVTQLDATTRSLALIADEADFDAASKRRRMVRFMVAALVVAAVGITLTVVRSQIDFGPDAQPTSTSAAAPPPAPTPTTAPAPTPSATSNAVDPGKVTHPTTTKPAPTSKPSGAPTFKAPGRKLKQPNDGTIVIPEPDEEGVAPAP